MGWQLVGVNLVERDDGDALLEASVLEQLFANLLVVDDDVVETATSGNLQGCRFIVVLWSKRDKRSDKTLDLSPVEVRMGQRVVEIQIGEPLLNGVAVLEGLISNRHAYMR